MTRDGKVQPGDLNREMIGSVTQAAAMVQTHSGCSIENAVSVAIRQMMVQSQAEIDRLMSENPAPINPEAS